MVNELTEKIALAKIKANKEIQLKRLKTKRISQPRTFQIGQQLNAEQGFLSELFGNGQRCMLPSEETLPPATLHGSLMPNAMGNEFDDGETTPNLFGWGSNRSTGALFGI